MKGSIVSEFERLCDTLWGPEGLGVKDIKFDFAPGARGSVEDLSKMIRLAIEDIQNGGGTPVDLTI